MRNSIKALSTKKALPIKIDMEFLFFGTSILLPVFGELLYFYSVCTQSVAGFSVFTFFVCFNLLLQVQCCFKSQSTIPNRGYMYALMLIFVSLTYAVPFFALILLIYDKTGNADAAVSIATLYVYAFSLMLGIIFIYITKYYRKKKRLAFIIVAYVVFLTSCILSSVFGDSRVYNIEDSTPGIAAAALDFEWSESATPAQQSIELEQFYTALTEADPSYVISEELSPVRNVGMLYRINSVSNIKAIVFDGPDFADQGTKVFAYVGIPKRASSEQKAPAIVLIHGAGGTASYSWVKQWTDRGYAAIAVSIFGAFPESEDASKWNRMLPFYLFGSGCTVAPNIDGMSNSSESIDIQWMYHAVGQTIIANSIIRSFEWVDTNRVGLCGISWGAVVASVTMTYDSRFSFAIPIFGSGYLKDSGGIIEQCYEDSITNELWAAENRFSHVKIPVLWICGNDDIFFSPQALSQSYKATKMNNINTQLSFQSGATHSHEFARSINEVYAFADSVTDNNKSFPYFINQPQGRSFEISVKSPNGFETAGATLYYLTQEWSIDNNKFVTQWRTLPLNSVGNIISCTVPDDCTSYYVDIQFNNGKSVYNISSEYVILSE